MCGGEKIVPSLGQTAAQCMRTDYGVRATKPLKEWSRWSKGTNWSIPLEGTFDVWRWEKFITEFKPRLQSTKMLEVAQWWLQKSIVVSKQGVQKAVSIRKNRVMYTWPEGETEVSDPMQEAEEALSGLTLLKRAGSIRPGPIETQPGPELSKSTTVTFTCTADRVTSDTASSSQTVSQPPCPIPQPSLAPAPSSSPPSVSNYEAFSTCDLQTICESRGIDTRLKNRMDCINELKASETTTTSKLYPDLGDLRLEGAVSEEIHLSPPMKPQSPRYAPSSLHNPQSEAYPVRVQQYEGPPNTRGERVLMERVVWHVPFTPAEIRTILAELPDYRTNPRGFARMFCQNQFSYGMSGTDCAQILQAKVGSEVASVILAGCNITTHEQATSGGKEFCIALKSTLPELYGANSTLDMMKLNQNPGEECVCFWQRLKQAALDADLDVGPDVPPDGAKVTPTHLLLRAKFLEGINTKIRDRLLLARPEYSDMSMSAILSTLSAIEREMNRKKQDKATNVLVLQYPEREWKRRDGRKKKVSHYKCHNCGQEGHIRKHCPKSIDKSGGRWHFIPDNLSTPVIGMVSDAYESS